MIPGAVEIVWHGVPLVLLPDRAAWMPGERTLLVADVHLGKPASFRAFGVPVPEAVTGRDLDRLSRLIHATRAERLIVLGDLVHDQAALLDRTCNAARAWRDAHPSVAVDLIPGNHDRRAPACERLGVRVLEPRIVLGGLTLTHEPPRHPDGPPTLCGHLHPVMSIGRHARVRAPCFRFEGPVGILPAFGSFTGGLALPADPGVGVFAAGEREVIAVTPAAAAWTVQRGSAAAAFA